MSETEDKPYIDENLSKNVTYTDHPHNNWEEVLSKKGDPKTGYNTIEKIANSSSDGGSSSGGAGVNILHAESSYDETTRELTARLTDVGPFENSDDGYAQAQAFLNDLAAKPTFVHMVAGTASNWLPVVRVVSDDMVIRCLMNPLNNDVAFFEFMSDEGEDGLLYFIGSATF